MVRVTPGTCWKIAGYANGKIFFERTLPYHHLTSGQASGLIQRLAARHLSPEDIVTASQKMGTSGRTDHLEVRCISGRPLRLTTAGDPYFTASVEACPDA